MSTFQDLLTACQAEAIDSVLNPTEEYIYRKMCRSYSIKFNTPLHEVYKLGISHIARNIFETMYEDIDLEEDIEQLLMTIKKIENPNYSAEDDEELDDFVKKIEEQEKQKKKNPPKKKTIIKTLETQKVKKDELKSGSINLGYLESLESEEEG